MARSKKKRNKAYHGADASAPSAPVIKRYEAVERGRVGDWWFDNKRRVRLFGILALIAGVLTLLVSAISGLLR